MGGPRLATPPPPLPEDAALTAAGEEHYQCHSGSQPDRSLYREVHKILLSLEAVRKLSAFSYQLSAVSRGGRSLTAEC